MAKADGISMMNSGVGINGITAPITEEFSIPGQKTGVPPALSFAGDEKGLSTYDGQNLAAVLDHYLTPRCGNPDLMTPHVFQQTLASALDKLSGLAPAGDQAGELAGLTRDISENNEIVRMFSSLVVQG